MGEKTRFSQADERDGAGSSSAAIQAPPEYSTLSSRFVSVSFHMYDKIRFLNFTPEETEHFKVVIETSHKEGIQKLEAYGPAMQFQLKGMPFLRTIPNQHQTNILVRELIRELYAASFSIVDCVMLCKKPNQKHTIVLERAENLPILNDWFCISFDPYDKVALQNAPKDFCDQLFRRLQSQDWTQENTTSTIGANETVVAIKLKRNYLMGQGQDSMTIRLILLTIYEVLAASSCRVVASLTAALSGHSGDMLVCARQASKTESGDLPNADHDGHEAELLRL